MIEKQVPFCQYVMRLKCSLCLLYQLTASAIATISMHMETLSIKQAINKSRPSHFLAFCAAVCNYAAPATVLQTCFLTDYADAKHVGSVRALCRLHQLLHNQAVAQPSCCVTPNSKSISLLTDGTSAVTSML